MNSKMNTAKNRQEKAELLSQKMTEAHDGRAENNPQCSVSR